MLHFYAEASLKENENQTSFTTSSHELPGVNKYKEFSEFINNSYFSLQIIIFLIGISL